MVFKAAFWKDSELTLGRVATRARQRRRELGLTQAEAAARAGMTVNRWAWLENGHGKPTCRELLGIARTLGLTLDELLGVEAPAIVG